VRFPPLRVYRQPEQSYVYRHWLARLVSKCEQVTVRAKRALPKYSVAARLVLVLAIDRRQLQHHAGVSKQRTRLVGEQIQFSFGILGKAEHSQP
jgi:hypothetical protein